MRFTFNIIFKPVLLLFSQWMIHMNRYPHLASALFSKSYRRAIKITIQLWKNYNQQSSNTRTGVLLVDYSKGSQQKKLIMSLFQILQSTIRCFVS